MEFHLQLNPHNYFENYVFIFQKKKENETYS
jgi:hypothetical protein